MDDVPTLTDMIEPARRPAMVPLQQRADPPTSPNEDFLQFFWHLEQLRQRLYDKFGYKVNRRIENYADGSACVKLICPPYGKGEPGSQPKQTTLSIGTTAETWQMNIGLSYLRDALSFFVRRQEMTAVANSVITHLTPEQREALRWTMSELR